MQRLLRYSTGKKRENYSLQISQEVRNDLESKGKDKVRWRAPRRAEEEAHEGEKGKTPCNKESPIERDEDPTIRRRITSTGRHEP